MLAKKQSAGRVSGKAGTHDKETSPAVSSPANSTPGVPCPPSPRQVEQPKPAHTAPPEPLFGVRYELLSDLNDATWEQEKKSKGTFAVNPSMFQLLLEVKELARVLTEVCRSHAGRCAQIHANCNDRDPAGAALKTVELALCEHLRLPPNPSLLMNELTTEPWPESNRLREFVLNVGGAPVELIGGELVTKPTLPRWTPKGGGIRRWVDRRQDERVQPEKNTPLLSTEETQRELRGLEESFRSHLCERLVTVYATAISAVTPLVSTAPAPRTQLAQAVADFLKTKSLATDREILGHLRKHCLWLIPGKWKEDGTLAGKYFTKIRKKLGISRKKTAR